jgi:hypothetical protein
MTDLDTSVWGGGGGSGRVITDKLKKTKLHGLSQQENYTARAPPLGPLHLRKSGSIRNKTWDLWICSQEL